MVDGNEMSVSFSEASCHMTSQCTWGMDLGSRVWLKPSVCLCSIVRCMILCGVGDGFGHDFPPGVPVAPSTK